MPFKSFFFSIILISLLFSLDGFDISSVLVFLLLPFINLKKLFIEESLIVKAFLFYNFLVLISIIINITHIKFTSIARPAAVVFFSFFILSNRSFILHNAKKFFLLTATSIVILDMIALLFFFVFGIVQLDGFKSFYPGLRFQGFYNLTISAVSKSFIVILLFHFKSQIKSFTFWFLTSILILTILLSLTRTAWIILIIYFVPRLVWNTFSMNKKNLKNIFYNVFKLSLPFLSLFTLLSVYNKDFEIAGFSVKEIFYNRLFSDSLGTESVAEIERGGLYYPLRLLETLEFSFFGNGFGTTDYSGGILFGSDENLGAHNTFVHILFDYGVLSFFTFLFFNFVLMIHLWRNIRYSKDFLLFIQLYLALLFAFSYQDLDYYLPTMFILLNVIVFAVKENEHLRVSRIS
ncbi:MAG: hypothetical protein RLZZ500_2578 [Bacteroidota bacterium]|jgi:hypothetical protein